MEQKTYQVVRCATSSPNTDLSKYDTVGVTSLCKRGSTALLSLYRCPITMNCVLALYNPSFANRGSHGCSLKCKPQRPRSSVKGLVTRGSPRKASIAAPWPELDLTTHSSGREGQRRFAAQWPSQRSVAVPPPPLSAGVRRSLRDRRTGRRVSGTRCRRCAPANQRVKTDAPPGHRLPAAPLGAAPVHARGEASTSWRSQDSTDQDLEGRRSCVPNMRDSSAGGASWVG
jgi:hypothetical protein